MGGRKAGFGHIARCIPLFDAVKENGQSAFFIVEGDNSIESLLDTYPYIKEEWLTNKEIQSVQILPDDQIIIDCLLPDQHILNYLKNFTKKIFVIDDSYGAKYNDAKIINWRVDAENTLFSGPSHVPLRREIIGFRKNNINPKVQEVLITLGGADIRNITPSVLAIFKTSKLSEIKLHVIIGGAFNNIEKYKKNNLPNVIFYYSPKATLIYKLMNVCDIAIAAGGHSIYELAYIGIPTIHLFVVDNQKPAEAWNKSGFTYPAGWYNNSDFFDKIYKGIIYFKDFRNREKASLVGQNLVDGLGAKRIANLITQS